MAKAAELVEMLTSDNAIATASMAFESSRGDFGARFTSAIEAVAAWEAKPEVFIDIPDRPQELSRDVLDQLVRPAAGYLRSSASKAELLTLLGRVSSRDHPPARLPG